MPCDDPFHRKAIGTLTALPHATLVDDMVAAIDIKCFAGDQARGVMGEKSRGDPYVVDLDQAARRPAWALALPEPAASRAVPGKWRGRGCPWGRARLRCSTPALSGRAKVKMIEQVDENETPRRRASSFIGQALSWSSGFCSTVHSAAFNRVAAIPPAQARTRRSSAAARHTSPASPQAHPPKDKYHETR